MPVIRARPGRSRFRVGHEVYVYPLKSLYLISSVLPSSQYMLCTHDGLQAYHGRHFPADALVFPHELVAYNPNTLEEFFRTVGSTSLDITIEILSEALHRISDDVPSCIGLSRSIIDKFGLPESSSDPIPPLEPLAETLATAPQKDSDRAVLFNTIGAWFGKRYEEFGSLEDINCAVKLLELALNHTTENYPNRAGILSNLGIWIIARYGLTGSIDDLHRAIELSTLAVATSSGDHPDRLGRLNNLANALSMRFQQVGDIQDIDRAIELLEEASARVPKRQANHVALYSSLAACYGIRHKKTGSKSDLEKAIRAAEAEHLGPNARQTPSPPLPKDTETIWKVTRWIEEQLATQTAGTAPEKPTSEPEENVVPPWVEEARTRVANLLKAADAEPPSTLVEVVRDRIWPFYSNWLHKAIGPCARTAEFDRNDDDSIASVSIFITCKNLPDSRMQVIIKDCTMELVPKKFNDHVVINIGEGTATPSISIMDMLTTSSEP
ncbi:hypothetical protein F4860DRAFT_159393 [Xylaria cubensis]|nr:hypothetical protein F4860DRAFT_159393 [Xylaria cubensis]